MGKDAILIGYFPDTLVTAFVSNEIYKSLDYLRELQVRYPGISYENPMASAVVGIETAFLTIKPLHEASEEDLSIVLDTSTHPGLENVINRMGLIVNP